MKVPRKMKSLKNWLVVWAVGIITAIVFMNKGEFYGIAQLLCAVPLVYTGCNVWQKSIFLKKSENETNED